jgi:hypothetical protein
MMNEISFTPLVPSWFSLPILIKVCGLKAKNCFQLKPSKPGRELGLIMPSLQTVMHPCGFGSETFDINTVGAGRKAEKWKK